MLTDAEYAAKMAIPDLTDKLDDGNELRFCSEDRYSEDDYNGQMAWKRALDQADSLNEQHYEDHISFGVVKLCQNYYVVDKKVAKKKFGVDFRIKPI